MGNPMKTGRVDGDAYGEEVRVAYVEDGVTKIALYRKVKEMRNGVVFIPSNKYKYVRDI